MKKFSSFGRLFNQHPAVFTKNNLDDISENSQNTQNAPDFLSEKIVQKQNDDSDTLKNNDFLHYPQSDYDYLQQYKTQNNQNTQNDLQKSQSTDPNTDNQDLQDGVVLSQKAKTLFECMRQHDNIVRNIKK